MKCSHANVMLVDAVNIKYNFTCSLFKFILSKHGSSRKTLHNTKYKYHYQFTTLVQQQDVEG
jgi:hypothetical protein